MSSFIFCPPLLLLSPLILLRALSKFLSTFASLLAPSPLSSFLTYAQLVPLPLSLSSSSSLVLLLFLPFLLSQKELLYIPGLSPALAVSSHPTFNQINSLFHSQGYDKVIMHGLCAAPAHTWTHTHTHTLSRWRWWKLTSHFSLKILWMSSVRESWQPGAPPINLSLHF